MPASIFHGPHRTPTIDSYDITTTQNGSCPACHHFHEAIPIDLHFSRDGSFENNMTCQRCGHLWLAIGGRRPRESLLSQFTDTTGRRRAGPFFRQSQQCRELNTSVASGVRSANYAGLAVGSPRATDATHESTSRPSSFVDGQADFGNDIPPTEQILSPTTEANGVPASQPPRRLSKAAVKNFKHRKMNPLQLKREVARRLSSLWMHFRRFARRQSHRRAGQRSGGPTLIVERPSELIISSTSGPEPEPNSTPQLSLTEVTNDQPENNATETPEERRIRFHDIRKEKWERAQEQLVCNCSIACHCMRRRSFSTTQVPLHPLGHLIADTPQTNSERTSDSSATGHDQGQVQSTNQIGQDTVHSGTWVPLPESGSNGLLQLPASQRFSINSTNSNLSQATTQISEIRVA